MSPDERSEWGERKKKRAETQRGKEEEFLQLTDWTSVKSGHIPARKKWERPMRHTGHICISHSALFAAVFIHFVPQLSTTHCLPPPLLSLLGCALPFPSMYIFRSRVIKSAPEGMCLNRISLILPCPHHTAQNTNTNMQTQTLDLLHVEMLAMFVWPYDTWDNSVLRALINHVCD